MMAQSFLIHGGLVGLHQLQKHSDFPRRQCVLGVETLVPIQNGPWSKWVFEKPFTDFVDCQEHFLKVFPFKKELSQNISARMKPNEEFRTLTEFIVFCFEAFMSFSSRTLQERRLVSWESPLLRRLSNSAFFSLSFSFFSFSSFTLASLSDSDTIRFLSSSSFKLKIAGKPSVIGRLSSWQILSSFLSSLEGKKVEKVGLLSSLLVVFPLLEKGLVSIRVKNNGDSPQGDSKELNFFPLYSSITLVWTSSFCFSFALYSLRPFENSLISTPSFFILACSLELLKSPFNFAVDHLKLHGSY